MGFLGWAALGVGAYFLLKPRQPPPRPGPAAAVGDSIVAHPGFTSGLNRLRGYSWQNHGIVGNTTRAMLSRSRQWASPRYSEILIMGNLNDMSPRLGPDWTIQNLRNLYRTAKETGARVVAVTSTPWRGHSRWTASEQADQDAVNRWIIGGADGIPDVVVDAYHPLQDPERPGHLRPAWASPDGLHLNARGEAALTRAIIDQAYRGVPFVVAGLGDEPAAGDELASPSDDYVAPLLVAAGLVLAGAAFLGGWAGKDAAREDAERRKGQQNPYQWPAPRTPRAAATGMCLEHRDGKCVFPYGDPYHARMALKYLQMGRCSPGQCERLLDELAAQAPDAEVRQRARDERLLLLAKAREARRRRAATRAAHA